MLYKTLQLSSWLGVTLKWELSHPVTRGDSWISDPLGEGGVPATAGASTQRAMLNLLQRLSKLTLISRSHGKRVWDATGKTSLSGD